MFNGPRFLVRILVIIFAGTTRLFGALLKKPEVKWNIQKIYFFYAALLEQEGKTGISPLSTGLRFLIGFSQSTMSNVEYLMLVWNKWTKYKLNGILHTSGPLSNIFRFVWNSYEWGYPPGPRGPEAEARCCNGSIFIARRASFEPLSCGGGGVRLWLRTREGNKKLSFQSIRRELINMQR